MLKNIKGAYNILLDTKTGKQQVEARKQKTRARISTVAKILGWIDTGGVTIIVPLLLKS